MNHIKNYLDENNTYGVDMTFNIDKDNNYVGGTSTGIETELELKMIYDNTIQEICNQRNQSVYLF
jgi:hypothetical protein